MKKYCLTQKKLSAKKINYQKKSNNSREVLNLKDYFKIYTLKKKDDLKKEDIGYDKNSIFNFIISKNNLNMR